MDKFWRFAALMLNYKRLIAASFAAALLDAACKVGGISTVGAISRIFFDTTREVALPQLACDALSKLPQSWAATLGPYVLYLPEDRWQGLAWIFSGILVLAVIGSTGRFFHEYWTFTVAIRTVARIRKAVFAKLIHQPMFVAASEKTAEQASRIVRDSQSLFRGFNALTGKTVTGIVSGLSLLAWALYVDWELAGMFMVVVPAIAVIIRTFGKRIRRASKKAMKEYGNMLGMLTETLQGLRVVKVYHAEGYERRRFNAVNRRVLGRQFQARIARSMGTPLIEMLSMTGLMIVVLIAAWSVFHSAEGDKDQRISVVIQVMVSLMLAAASFKQLSGLNNTLQEAAAAAENIDEVLHMPTESSPRAVEQRDLPVLPRHHQSVIFENVTFAYPGRETPALRDINLHVPCGTVCAVVGANGSGKSTLLGLLPRLYDPSAGRIMIDGVDIRKCTLRSLRRQIAVVTQETVLFDSTVAENIIYGSRHVGHERMIAAARRAHAHDFITQLPEGYDTPIGERGQRLSGGQRQRIAIARAILRDPAILILDEATSQIDADSEAQINEALAEFVTGRTTFVIAHRLSTVVHADRIVVMADGSIASIGTHAELLKTSDVYRVLCRTQLHGLEG